jgi:two-component system, chemotaxis family, chemotaxis protein CheY
MALDKQLRRLSLGLAQPSPARFPYLPPMKLLIVEDTIVVRVILRRWLRSLGLADDEILEADNGQVGLMRFESHAPDAVITDWHMPIMDGLMLVQAIRQQNKTVPILMITTQSDREQVVSALRAGASDYLIKPFSAAELRNKLSKVLASVTSASGPSTGVAQDSLPASC